MAKKADLYKVDNRTSYLSDYDVSKNQSYKPSKLRRLRNWFGTTFSLGTRNLFYIFPGLAILAIPAWLGYFVYKDVTIAQVPLYIWAIWLGVCWFSLFATRIAVYLIPYLFEWFLGQITPDAKRYMDYIRNLHFYISACAFFCIAFISFDEIMVRYNTADGNTLDWQSTMNRVLAVTLIGSVIVLLEKLLLQIIAVQFHKTTYQDRIEAHKYRIQVLTTLYEASQKNGILLDSDDMGNKETTGSSKKKLDIGEFLSKTTMIALSKTTSTLGQIAAEILGHEHKSQDDEFEAATLDYLSNSHDARILGNQLFHAFCPPDRDYILPADTESFFPNHAAAKRAFDVFDKDGNGNLTKEEMVITCVEAYKERIAIAASLRDLDHAVGKLDSVLMVAVYIFIILLLIAFLDISFQTYIATAASIVLALSFIISPTAQEIFQCIILLFVKHPFDVGDRIVVDDQSYIVKEMTLLTTTLIHGNGQVTQAANNLLAEKFIQNIRRSGNMHDSITIEVDFYTTLEQIEALRARMNKYLEGEERDFYPTMELVVSSIPECRQLVLNISVQHKSNWQDDGVTCRRKNKFMCQLKTLITELDIQGPFNAPSFPVQRMLQPNRPLRVNHHRDVNTSQKPDFALGAKSDVFNIDDTTEAARLLKCSDNTRPKRGDEEENDDDGKVDIVVTNEKEESQ